MVREFNHERAAMILCDAVMMGDRAAADKWGLTQRSIQRYREKLETDDKLRHYVAKLQAKQEQDWAGEIPKVLAEGMAFLKGAFVQNRNGGGVSNPETIAALTGAIEVLADIDLTRTIIAARLKDTPSGLF
jgi:hypothetical protein